MKKRLPAILTFLAGFAAANSVAPARLFPQSTCGALCASPSVGDAGAGATVERIGPRVAVDREQYDFGRSDVDAAGRHAFVFTNTGDEPLTLTGGRSTCGCCTCLCSVRLPTNPVAPGGSTHVTLEWKSKLYVGLFRQTATISTNDASRPEVTLSIAGRFTGPVGVAPSQVVLSGVRLGQATTREVRVYSYLDEPFAIIGCEHANRQNGKYFDVAWERLSAGQLKEEGEARHGYLVRIAVKAGLPVGAFQQVIRLQTNAPSMPRVDIPVQGTVVSDISIAGRGWNAETGVLTMGMVSGAEGAEWPLLIVVRGPHAQGVELKPIRVSPGALAVELGATRYVAETSLSLTRLTIRVPPGNTPLTHLGAERGEPGRITIQTNHPELSELNIQVRFGRSADAGKP